MTTIITAIRIGTKIGTKIWIATAAILIVTGSTATASGGA